MSVATIYIDGEPRQVDSTQNLLHVLLSLGYDVPYFCWHPALGSVGACRQCAVKQFRDEQDKAGKMIMACMTAAVDGTRISIKDPGCCRVSGGRDSRSHAESSARLSRVR